MFIRKFYDADVAEPRFKIGEQLDSKEFFSQEVNDVEGKEDKVDEKSEEKKEVKNDKIEDKKTDEKVEDKKEDAKIGDKKVEVVAPDWKELLKKADRKEALKLLEVDEDALTLGSELKADEFVNKLISYRKQHGNVNPFIEAATKDWTKFSHEQLIMDDLKKQYSTLSADKAEKLAKSDFNSRFIYKDDPNLPEAENEELAELTAIKLEAEGEKIRAAGVANQKEYLDSVKAVEKTNTNDETAKAIADYQKKTADDVVKFKSMVESDPEKAKLVSTKKLVLGKGDSSFNHSANPELIIEQTLDVNKFDDQFWHKGKFNFLKFAKVAAYAQDPDGFEEALINHGRSLSTKKVSEELENAKEEKTDKKSEKKKSLAKTFAEEGVAMKAEDL